MINDMTIIHIRKLILIIELLSIYHENITLINILKCVSFLYAYELDSYVKPRT